jgi:hypothetical protein
MLYYFNFNDGAVSYRYRPQHRSWWNRINLLRRKLCHNDVNYTFLPQFSNGHPLFHKTYLYTYKYAKFLFKSNPPLYFELMNFDSSFLSLADCPEDALIAAITDAKMRGWNGII